MQVTISYHIPKTFSCTLRLHNELSMYIINSPCTPFYYEKENLLETVPI